MADRITQIKSNVAKMIDGGASESEIDAYLGHEGVTADQLKGAGKVSGSFLPLSTDAQGNVSFDARAGLLGTILSAITAPGDVVTGKLDPMSPEGRQRAFDLAATITPVNPGVASGARALPGELRAVAPVKKPPIPTAEELKNTANAGYKAVRETGAEYPGQAIGALADDVQRTLEADGIIAELSPQTFTVLNKLRNPPDGSVVTISSIDAARKTLNRIAGNYANPTEQEAARRAIERLDDFIKGNGQTTSVAGAPAAAGASAADRPRISGPVAPDAMEAPKAEAARLLEEARGNAAARFRSDRITGAENAAELRSDAANSGLNIGNQLRQRIASILLDPKKARGYSKDELAAMEKIVRGNPLTNTTRHVGNLFGGGGGLGSLLTGAVGGMAGGSVGGGALPGVVAGLGVPAFGFANRLAYNALSRRQMRLLDEMIRKRSPLYQTRLANPPMEVIDPLWRSLLFREALLAPDSGN